MQCIGQLYTIMGLFGFGTKTKADWDRKIIDLNSELARSKSCLADAKKREQEAKRRHQNIAFSHGVNYWQGIIERLKADIANAKIERKNAPK